MKLRISVPLISLAVLLIGCDKKNASPDGAEGTKATSDQGGASPAAGPTIAVARTQTICIFGVGSRTVLAAIKADGTFVRRVITFPPTYEPDGPVNYGEVYNGAEPTATLSAYALLARAPDGAWRSIDPDNRETDLPKATDHVAEIAGSYSIPWKRGDDGELIVEGVKHSGGPSANPIVKLCAQVRHSERLTMLLADGTVFLNDPRGRTIGNVKGLQGITDLAVWSPYGENDTGVALRTDGSAVFWGMTQVTNPDVLDTLKYNTPALTPLQIPAKVVRVAAGRHRGGAIDVDGNLWSWDATHPPSKKKGVENAAEILFSDEIDLALLKDGRVLGWWRDRPIQEFFKGIKLP